MNGDEELADGVSGAARTDGDEAVQGVANAVSSAVDSVRRQLARVHAGLPPVDDEQGRHAGTDLTAAGHSVGPLGADTRNGTP